MRLVTFYVNGNVYMTSGTMRVGTEGTIADYTINKEGKGSLIIGITDDGKLKEFGYYPCALTSNKLFNGFEFGGMEIPSYKQAIDLVKKSHLRLSYIGYIGWDVTIDINIRGAGCLYYQYTNGSLF